MIKRSTKRALVVEGGGMRGAHSAGVLKALAENGITDFDVVAGTSAGACTSAFMVSRQFHVLTHIWEKHVHGRKLIRFSKLLSNESIMDLDYLIDHIFGEKEPLDVKAIKKNPIPFYISATHCETGRAHHFHSHHDPILPALKASSSLPIVYKNPVIVDGERYIDGGFSDPIPIGKALEHECDEIWVVLTRPFGFRKKTLRWDPMPGLYRKTFPELADALAKRHDIYNLTMDRIEGGKLPAKLYVIQPQIRTITSRLSTSQGRILACIEQGFEDALKVIHK